MSGGWKHVAPSVVVLVMLLGVLGVQPAFAQAPSNDTEGAAVVVGPLPFSYAEDASEATAGGPRFCSNSGSVFFTFTPSEDARVQVDLIGSQYDTVLGVYTRNAANRVEPLECNDDRFGLASGVRFPARAGTTYVIMVGTCCRNGIDGGGELALWVDEVADIELEATMTLDATGTVDATTGIATIGGTASCNERSVVYREGVLRQLRQGLFIARGYWGTQIVCTPDGTNEWSVEVDTDTGVAFGAGSAQVKYSFVYASDGFREFTSAELEDETIQLQSA